MIEILQDIFSSYIHQHPPVQVSECIDQVPGASRDEAVVALQSYDWNTGTSVERLKIQQLLQCSPRRWKLGMLQSSGTCEMVLKSCKWDLEQAVREVTVSKRDSGPNHTQVNKDHLNYFSDLSTRSPPMFLSASL